MISFKEYITNKLQEDAPANSVGSSSPSPPAAPNATSTNVPTKRLTNVLRRKKPVGQ